MTRDELNRRRMMFQIYANRNKIPQMQKDSNQNPLKHSATNEFLEFRKKVAAGVRMQKDNDTSNLFNVTEANAQYRQDLMDQNIIIHAGTSTYGDYYEKIDNYYGPGKARYFDTKEEYEAYQRVQDSYYKKAQKDVSERNLKNNQSNRDSAVSNSSKGITDDARNKNAAASGQNAYQTSYRNSLLNKNQSGREDAISKSQKNAYNESTLDKAQEAFAKSQSGNTLSKAQSGRDAAIRNSQGGSKEDVQDISNTVKGYNASRKEYEKNAQANPEAQRAQKMMENADKEDAKNITDKVRSYNASRKEWEKNSQANPEAQRAAKESERADSKKQAANQSGSANSAKSAGEDYDNWKAEQARLNKSGNYQSSKSEGEAQDAWKKEQAKKEESKRLSANQSGSANAAEEEGRKASSFKKNTTEHNAKVDAQIADREYKAAEKILRDKSRWEAYLPEVRDYVIDKKMHDNGFKGLRDIYKYEGGAEKFFDDFEDELNEELQKRYGTKGLSGAANSIKHDTYDDDYVTTDEMTPEQEYLAFRAKVEAGLKHYGMSRSLMTVPINRSLAHAGTGKYGDYYDKIDNYYGPGKTRYFSTKEEWDAHQRRLEGYAKKAEKDVAERDKKIAMQNEWNKNSQANPGAQRGSREYVNGKIANKQNQKETANKSYYNTQSQANPEQMRGNKEAAQGRLAGSNFTPSTTSTGFKGTPNMNLYGVDNNVAAQNTAARNTYQDIYRNDLLNRNQSGREAAIANSQKNAYRNNLLAQAQSGRDAAMNNSGSLVEPKSSGSLVNRMVQNIGGKLLEAENRAQKDARNNNLASAGQSSYQDIYRNNLLAQAQSGREAAINNSAPSTYEGIGSNYGPQSGRALEAEFVGRDQDFFNTSKAQDEEALQKYIAKELGVTKRIIADGNRWRKYRSDIKNIVMDQMMDYYGFNNLSDIYKYEGGPEAFFDDLEAAIAKESMRLTQKTT